MVRLFDLNLSTGKFALRVALALILAATDAFLFYYLPTHLGSLISGFLRGAGSSNIESMISGLVNPALPLTGIGVALLVFLSTLFKGSKLYGVILVANGSLFSIYTYLVFQGGTMLIKIPTGLVQGLSGSIGMDLTLLMWLLILPSLLTMVKGGVLLLQSRRHPIPDQHAQAIAASKSGEQSALH